MIDHKSYLIINKFIITFYLSQDIKNVKISRHGISLTILIVSTLTGAHASQQLNYL